MKLNGNQYITNHENHSISLSFFFTRFSNVVWAIQRQRYKITRFFCIFFNLKIQFSINDNNSNNNFDDTNNIESANDHSIIINDDDDDEAVDAVVRCMRGLLWRSRSGSIPHNGVFLCVIEINWFFFSHWLRLRRWVCLFFGRFFCTNLNSSLKLRQVNRSLHQFIRIFKRHFFF